MICAVAASVPREDTLSMGAMSAVNESQSVTRRAPTLGEDLARRRAEVRVLRLERVLSALRDREQVYEREGAVPPPLRAAIRDFSTELEQMRSELASALAPNKDPSDHAMPGVDSPL